jgi:hypothetical protein
MNAGFLEAVSALIIWSFFWMGLGLWFSAKNNERRGPFSFY